MPGGAGGLCPWDQGVLASCAGTREQACCLRRGAAARGLFLASGAGGGGGWMGGGEVGSQGETRRRGGQPGAQV